MSALNLRPAPGGIGYDYTGPDGVQCVVAVVLTSAAEVDLYRGAGDAVAVDPAGDAGVKFLGDEMQSCKADLTAGLGAVR